MCPAYSTTTWEDKSAPTSHQDSDPILFTYHQTNRTIAGMLLLRRRPARSTAASFAFSR
ncbi:MAG TPA: hypothetical protein VHQ90_07490 [Thermoanaerobaculia bacterium]|nr:hypothetical protein [Thermoanaerobaculia bacterium]